MIWRKEKISLIADDVTSLPIDGNRIRAVADVFYDGLILLQLLKELVEVADLQISAEADCSSCRTELAKKNAQEGCLAAAVGAKNSNPIALQNRGGKL